MGQEVSQQLIEQHKERQQSLENENTNLENTQHENVVIADDSNEETSSEFHYSQPKDVKETNSSQYILLNDTINHSKLLIERMNMTKKKK